MLLSKKTFHCVIAISRPNINQFASRKFKMADDKPEVNTFQFTHGIAPNFDSYGLVVSSSSCCCTVAETRRQTGNWRPQS